MRRDEIEATLLLMGFRRSAMESWLRHPEAGGGVKPIMLRDSVHIGITMQDTLGLERGRGPSSIPFAEFLELWEKYHANKSRG